MPIADKTPPTPSKTLEELAMEWQSKPDTKKMIPLIQSGELLLIPAAKLREIESRMALATTKNTEYRQALADIEYRYQILLNGIKGLLLSTIGITKNIPTLLALVKSINLVDSEGINWGAAVRLCTDFMFGRGQSKKITPLIAEMTKGFDEQEFQKIQFPEILGIMNENEIDTQGFAQVYQNLQEVYTTNGKII